MEKKSPTYSSFLNAHCKHVYVNHVNKKRSQLSYSDVHCGFKHWNKCGHWAIRSLFHRRVGDNC